ncbi:hypothetical protein EXIGLDRAFT_478292 [Exidia glandulosa HHB12029]|uniref:Uncharacterized protein n=1 Tax=Exidia glandulosa HHB12029 TaxID=1314781 RepID=A0A165JTG2_EXIGL|nr:hypothetical protein EXIGLDRAFT_478292 [Exidia glandulosa HHB12029]
MPRGLRSLFLRATSTRVHALSPCGVGRPFLCCWPCAPCGSCSAVPVDVYMPKVMSHAHLSRHSSCTRAPSSSASCSSRLSISLPRCANPMRRVHPSSSSHSTTISDRGPNRLFLPTSDSQTRRSLWRGRARIWPLWVAMWKGRRLWGGQSASAMGLRHLVLQAADAEEGDGNEGGGGGGGGGGGLAERGGCYEWGR